MAEQPKKNGFLDFAGSVLTAAAPAIATTLGSSILGGQQQQDQQQFSLEQQGLANQNSLELAQLQQEGADRRAKLEAVIQQLLLEQQKAQALVEAKQRGAQLGVNATLQGSANQVAAGNNFTNAVQAPLLRPITSGK